jgi:hypothetical protein
MNRLLAPLAFLTAAITACTASPTASPSPSALAGLPAEVIGTWTTTITKDDLRSKGFTDEHVLDENSGRLTWTFAADGTWTFVQASLDNSPVFNPIAKGTWTGGPGTMTVTQTFPTQFADQGVHWTWRVEDGKLVLHVLDPPDPMYPMGPELHPLVRVTG